MDEIDPELIAKLKAMDPEKLRTKPLRLSVAARMAFPDGTMGAPGLRKERDKGRLATEMIAGKEFTTLAEIERMRERCRVQRKAPDLSGARKAAKQTAPSGVKPAGTSRTMESEPALALAVMKAMKLKNGSRPTSQRNTRPQPVAPEKPAGGITAQEVVRLTLAKRAASRKRS